MCLVLELPVPNYDFDYICSQVTGMVDLCFVIFRHLILYPVIVFPVPEKSETNLFRNFGVP